MESTKEFDVNVTVHLSGTPYRILMSDEFDREQDLIAFYQFTDIVREQEEWDRDNFAKDEPKEEWENVFEKFYRASNHGNKDGSGLGLMVAKHIVARHFGKIWVTSDEVKKTCFYIEFPECSEEAMNP